MVATPPLEGHLEGPAPVPLHALLVALGFVAPWYSMHSQEAQQDFEGSTI